MAEDVSEMVTQVDNSTKGMTPSSREILASANLIIHGERAQSYGPAEESFDRIARLWSVYLEIPLNSYDVDMLMILMKVSRAKTDVKRDTFVDIAGYAGLAERCAVQSGRMMTEVDLKPIMEAIRQTEKDIAAARAVVGARVTTDLR